MKMRAVKKAPARLEKRGVFVVLKAGTNESELVRESGRRVLYFGIGKKNEMTHRRFVTLIRRIIKTAKAHRYRSIVIRAADFHFPKALRLSTEALGEAIAREAELANFEFLAFKRKPKEGWNLVAALLVVEEKHIDALGRGLRRGQMIADGVNEARVLSNMPGGDMTPAKLADAAKKAARGTRVSVRVWGRRELERKKMGAILGVARGSKAEPKMIVMEYMPLRGKRVSLRKRTKINADYKKPIVLVGKGITFDTGGLNLKPTSSILDMHMDMSGGAAVIHSVVLAAKLGIQKNVIALVPAAENMVSGESFRPGDILKSHSGKTIEVLNTDAEGRLILADALSYAKKYNPRLVVDVATLTGGALVALGQRASALLASDEKWHNLFMELGEESGDYLWPLPLWEEYEEDVKGVFADVANIPANGHQGYASTINGAAFLAQFVKDDAGKYAYPWVHLDIAPRMVSANGDHLAKGAAGAPVRLLIKLLEKYY